MNNFLKSSNSRKSRRVFDNLIVRSSGYLFFSPSLVHNTMYSAHLLSWHESHVYANFNRSFFCGCLPMFGLRLIHLSCAVCIRNASASFPRKAENPNWRFHLRVWVYYEHHVKVEGTNDIFLNKPRKNNLKNFWLNISKVLNSKFDGFNLDCVLLKIEKCVWYPRRDITNSYKFWEM